MTEEKLLKLDNSKVVETYKSNLTMQNLFAYVKHGFPECKSKMDLETKNFWNYHLSLVINNDNLLLYGDQLLVPDPFKKKEQITWSPPGH